MNYTITEVCLIAIASCTVLMTILSIVVMGRLFKTLKKVDEISSEMKERVNETNKGFGYIAQAVQVAFDFYGTWKENKVK